MNASPTLYETPADLGWSSSETTSERGRAVRCDRGHELGTLTAGETWAELRARGLIDGEQPEPASGFHCACAPEAA